MAPLAPPVPPALHRVFGDSAALKSNTTLIYLSEFRSNLNFVYYFYQPTCPAYVDDRKISEALNWLTSIFRKMNISGMNMKWQALPKDSSKVGMMTIGM